MLVNNGFPDHRKKYTRKTKRCPPCQNILDVKGFLPDYGICFMTNILMINTRTKRCMKTQKHVVISDFTKFYTFNKKIIQHRLLRTLK